MKKALLKTQQNIIILEEAHKFFTSSVFDRKLYSEIIALCENDPLLNRFPNHIQILKDMGYFTYDQFRSYLIKKDITGFTFDIPQIILEVFVDLMIVQKIEKTDIGINTDLYKTAEIDIAKFYRDRQILLNRIFGFNYIIDEYINSVFKIENILDGQSSIGNGFLIGIKNEKVILTNKHVVNNCTSLKIYDYSDKELNISDMIISSNSDLAIVKIEENDLAGIKVFQLNESFQVLDEIITIGYPPIPTAKECYPLCHKGEINSSVETYWGDKLFIYSAKTNPGNSGSPIIDTNGTIVGIVTEQLEEHEGYKKGKLPYYAGIPAQIIFEFIESIAYK